VERVCEASSDLRAGTLETRTSLHRGKSEMRGEQPSGLAVHPAARVMAAAAVGEILVSDALREALAEADLSLTDRGRHELRGVPGEWQLYAAEPASAGG
jgi:class 3 adenylate cyclase